MWCGRGVHTKWIKIPYMHQRSHKVSMLNVLTYITMIKKNNFGGKRTWEFCEFLLFKDTKNYPTSLHLFNFAPNPIQLFWKFEQVVMKLGRNVKNCPDRYLKVTLGWKSALTRQIQGGDDKWLWVLLYPVNLTHGRRCRKEVPLTIEQPNAMWVIGFFAELRLF